MSKFGTVLLIAAFVSAAATSGYAQRATRGATTGMGPGTAPSGQTPPGVASRPLIPGAPGSAFGSGVTTGMPTRPLIPGTPGTSFGTMSDPGRFGCRNGAVAADGSNFGC